MTRRKPADQRAFWQRRLLPAFALLLAVNVLGFASWTFPRGHHHRNAAERAKLARAEAAQARETLAALRARAAAIRSNAEELKRFYAREAGEVDVVPTLESIEQMVRATGLKPAARTLARDRVEGTSLERVGIALPLEGSYGQLVDFLGDVETSPRFLVVDRVAMRANDQRGASLQVELSAFTRSQESSKGPERRGRAR